MSQTDTMLTEEQERAREAAVDAAIHDERAGGWPRVLPLTATDPVEVLKRSEFAAAVKGGVKP